MEVIFQEPDKKTSGWYSAVIKGARHGFFFIHYDNFENSSVEIVEPHRMRWMSKMATLNASEFDKKYI